MSPVVASRRFSSARVLSFLFANLIWLAPLFLAPATNAFAQDTFTVSVTTDPGGAGTAGNCPANNPGGSGSCSLRDAIAAANADTANSAIVDMTSLSGTITLVSALPIAYPTATTNSITFTATVANGLTVSGNGQFQVFVVENGLATFQNFTIANGFVSATGGCTCDPGLGAGIYQYSQTGSLTLNNMILTGNFAASDGGAVVATGPLTVTNSTFSNNSVGASSLAGAIYAVGATNTIYQSTFFGNSAYEGAAIFLSDFNPTATLTISDSTFANNSEPNLGSGAIVTESGTTLTIHDSTFWNNNASYTDSGVLPAGVGGSLNNSGTMTVTDSIFGAPGTPTQITANQTQFCYSVTTCPANGDGNGNVVGGTSGSVILNLSSLGYYGGPTETLLPLAGSAAICGGTTAGALNVGGTALTVDQRGFGLDPNCGAGTTDAGSVQVQANGILTVQTANDDPGSTVTTCGPTCTTLRDAINTANTQGTGDIEFAGALSGGTLTLGGILPKIEGAIAINGPSGGFTIDGGNNYEAFWVDGGASLNIANLTIQNASTAKTTSGAFAQGYGGAIFNTSNLTVSNSSFLNNTAGNATGGGQANPSEGGAILNTGSLTIANSNFSGNTASNTPTYGGSGGAITSSGPLTITDSTFSTNTGNDGGAIYLDTPNPVVLQYDTFSGNVTNTASFSGAVYNQGLLTVQNSTFAGNTNGGIHSSGYTLNVTNSIFGETSECDPSQSPDCPASGFGNDYATAPVNLSALGNYGGSIPTILPQPGSSAICAGLQADIPSGFSTDQRGFSNATPSAYGCTAGTSDAGSVQTNYMSAQFVGGPYTGNTNSPSITPTVVVSVTEANQNQGGIPVTLTLAGGADTIAAGTGTATSATGVGASFGNLTVDGTGGAYTLSTTIPVVGAYALSAGPVNLTLTSGPTIVMSPSSLPAATVGAAYSQQMSATGGTPAYTWTETGTLPAGITLTTGGLLHGTPTEAGSFSITITATDSDGFFNRQTYTLTVGPPTITMTPVAGTLNVTTGVAYSQVFTASGGTAPYTYGETGALPINITWNASTHTLSGTTTDTGSFPITINVTDNSTGTGSPFSQSFSYTLTVSAPTITITPGTLTAATVGTAFSQQLTAAGGAGPYTYAVTSGALPAGVTLTASGASAGLLAGTPTAGGSFTFTVTATDSDLNTGAQAYTWTVNAPTITITPAAGTLNATTNIAYSQVFTATGGTTPYTWTETGTLPVGITWNASTHTLAGTTTATGSFPIAIKAQDNSTGTGPYSQSNSYTLVVGAPTITITPAPLTAATVGVAFSQQLTAAGGTGPYTYAVTTGTLPAGVTLTTGGLLAGTATAGGSFAITVTATDSNTNKGTQSYTWTVNAPTITITPAAGTLNATENITFTQVFAATGGTTPYTWTETGALPAGITWTAATATLSGKATVTGSFPITIKAQDNSTGTGPYSQSNSYTLSVTAPAITITPATLTAATVGTAFSQQLTAAGGAAPYTYAVTTGTLPAGVTLTTGGLLAGTATAGGSFAITVTATDSNTNKGTQSYTWTVNAPTITITPAAGTLNATENITFTQVFAATGGTTPYTWTETGALPAGITWTAATATLSGKATVTGSFPITIKAQDNSTGTGPYSQSNSYTLSVTAPAITITPATLTAATVGTAFSQQLTAAGGAAPYTYAVTTGTLPAGVTLTTGGLLAGTPTAGGSFAITVTATDSNTNKGTQSYTWTVNAPTITITPAAGTLNATENITFTQVFAATGGTTPYTWVETGALPAGITWDAATATLTGKATATGSFPITIKATDSSTGTGPYSQSNSYTLSVTAPAITITPATLTAATVGTAFSQQLTAAGGTAPYTYAVTTGTLPAGVTLTTGGLLAGTPTAGGSFAITVTATDSNTNKGTQGYTWTVNAPTITITPAAGTLTATGDAAYSQVFAATGGDSPYTWVETGALPAGITWNAATATLSGTPTASGSFPITIKATDSSTGTGPYSQTNSYTLTVSAPTITVTPTTLPTASIAVAYSQQLAASGGTGPYTFTETGTLPGGITLSTGGLLSGTATAGGSFPITVTAKDANSFTGTKSYTLTVNAATIVITPAAGTLTATSETAYSQVFAATGGDSPYTWVETGALPAGITWNAATATLSGTPTASGSFPITIKATDSSTGSGPYSVTNNYTLTVSAPTITIAPATLTAAQVAAAYSQQLTASGGIGTYTYTVTTGTLPAGITLSTGGLLAGTPTVAGSFPITVTAKDGDNFTGTQTYTLTVNGPNITILPATLPAASTNVAYTQAFTASGGTSPYTWTETGALPTGVTFNAATATLSGTPTQSGTFPITIKATDSTTGTGSPFSKSVGYTLAVSAPTITITPTTLPAAAIAVAYSQSLTASGGTAPYTYSVTTGALPAGLTLSTAGAITGTATAGGSFSFTVTAKDSGNFTGTQSYSLTVNAPTISLAPPAGSLTITTNAAFSQTFTASGGTAPYTYTEAGALPAGLTFANGVLSGTATASGTFPITVTAKDSSTGGGPYSSAAIAYTLNVGTTSISITWANPAAITYGTSLSGALNATVTYNGSPVPGTFSYTATPSGGSASAVTAATVLAAGSYTLTATFTPSSNAYGTPSPKTVPLTVNQAQPTVTWTPATSIPYGTTLSALLNATASFNSTSVAGSFAYTATPTGGSATAVTGATKLAQGNYTLTATFTPTDTADYKTATASSPLAVTGGTLTVSANNASKVYGTANPTFTGTITGQQNGDTFTESFTTTATATSNVGTYAIVPTAAGANLSNYTVVTDDGTLTVTQAGSTTTLAVNSTSVSPGATVTLTATVTSATTGTPTGTVNFYDGTTLLNTATLSGGIATYSTTSLAAGSSNSLTAVYSGDTNFTSSSTASPIIVTVGGLDFTIAVTPATQTGLSGTTFTYQVAIAPAVAGQPYPGAVTFTATGLPPGATATFTPTSVAAGAGSKTVSMAVATSSSSAAVQPLSTGRKLIPVALAFLLLPLAGTRRMRREGRRFGQMICLLLLALGGIVATAALSGCGSSNGGFGKGGGQGTTYTIDVKATSGNVNHSSTVTLTIQ